MLLMIWNSSPESPEEVLGAQSVHLLQFGTSLTRAGGQYDVRSNKLPQIITIKDPITKGKHQTTVTVQNKT